MSNETLITALLAQARRDGFDICDDHRVAFHGECPQCAYEAKYVSNPDEGDAVFCEKHGETEIVTEFGFTGYAGGKCFGYEYACGCTSLDESNDLSAAY